MRIIKTFALDVPKGKEVFSTIDGGKKILFDDFSYISLPEREWKILSVKNGIIHLLPKSKEEAINGGWINKK